MADNDKLFRFDTNAFMSKSLETTDLKTFNLERNEKDLDLTEDLKFEIQLTEVANSHNSSFTKCNADIFYKGLNRNGSFITEFAANKIIKTLAYSPIIAEYDEETGDFTSHTDETTPYGVITADEVEWVEKKDKDGITRTYASVAVYLWTSKYPIAAKIVGKKLSMELDPETVTGEWRNDDGFVYYVIKDVNGYAVAVLGDKHEPCFEGAVFYEKVLTDIGAEFEELKKEFRLFSIRQGGESMNKISREITFKLSHSEIDWKLFDAMNPNGEFTVAVREVYDDYFIAYDYEAGQHFKVSYTSNKDNTVAISEDKIAVEPTYATAEEMEKLENFRNGTFEKEMSELKEQFADFKTNHATELEAKDVEINALTETVTEKDTTIAEFTTKVAEQETLIADKDTELVALNEFKVTQETAKKNELIDEFAKILTEEDVRPVREAIVDFTYDEIEAKLSVIAVRNKVSFAVEDPAPAGDDDEADPEPIKKQIANEFDLDGDEGDNVPGWVKTINKHRAKKGID